MMSYNTRRSGGFGNQAQPAPQQQSVANIGQRRPVVTNNFVPGGQLNSQNKAGAQMPTNQQHMRPPHQQAQQQPQQQQQQAQKQNSNIQFRNQQQNQGYQQVPAQPQQQQQQPPQQQVKPEPQPQLKNVVIQGANPPNPALENVKDDAMDTSEEPQKKRPFWAKGGNKISKKEKIRRRNIRLSKMLQPKNAVMILNELVKNTSYMVDELPLKVDSNQFKATVLVEGIEHVGLGRSKIQAKNTAAETALRQLIKSNKLAEMKKDEEGNEKMDVAEDGVQPPLPWQHVASFALFKLFSSWGEDPNNVKGIKNLPFQTQGGVQLNNSGSSDKHHENKPAKKMPDNPETMNPLMLLNQMLPHAQFEEIGKSGNPPNVTYSFRCNVDGQSFIGTGPNKKAAKKLAAFGACHKMLNITYSPDVYVPIY